MSTTLHLLSWNIFGSPVASDPVPKMQRMAHYFDRLQPDVVLLQEVWTREQVGVFQALERYEPFTRTADRWWLVPRKGGLMTLVRRDSPWRVSSFEFKEFDAEAPDLFVLQGDGIADKGAQRMVLRHEQDGLELTVLNTHLQSPYWPKWIFHYEDVRRRQLEELEELAGSDDGRMPVLAAGDLNLGPETDNYHSLERFWTDLCKEERESCKCGTHDGQVGGAADWIDYLLARPTAAVAIKAKVIRLGRCDASPGAEAPRLELCSEEQKRAKSYLSDHHGLEAWITFERVSTTSALDAALLAAITAPSSRRQWLALASALGVRGLTRPAGLLYSLFAGNRPHPSHPDRWR